LDAQVQPPLSLLDAQVLPPVPLLDLLTSSHVSSDARSPAQSRSDLFVAGVVARLH